MSKNEPIASLGYRLRTLRKQHNLTQVEVAVAVGTTRTNLTKIETGKSDPGREVLNSLASFYQVSLDWLTTGHGSMQPAAAAAENEDEALLLYAFRALPKEEAKPLLQMLLSRVKPAQGN